MIFGNAAWGFRETPIEKQFKITSQMGLKFLEIGIANAPNDIQLDVSVDELIRIKGMSETYGVKMFAAATGNDFTVKNDDVDKIKKVIDICEILEIKNLRTFAGFKNIA